MKKIILSLSFIVFTLCYVNAQSFTLSWDGAALADTVTVLPDTVGSQNSTFKAILTNNSSKDAEIKLARNEIFMVDTAYSDFCWGDICWPPEVDTSGIWIVAAGGSSAEGDFSGYYHANFTVGVSIIEYTWYDVDNPDDNVKVVVKFDNSIDAINENILRNIWVSELYPNPATNYVVIDYNMPAEVKKASVKIVNLLGSVVKEQKIDARNNKMKLDIFDLNGGVYFYSINVNDEIYRTKKLIIR
ncbi:MAG: hypothetical protein CL661_12040 [Bacteroidetes bacterium]|nr:hypothetical protein [Bacteroidota bacterium]